MGITKFAPRRKRVKPKETKTYILSLYGFIYKVRSTATDPPKRLVVSVRTYADQHAGADTYLHIPFVKAPNRDEYVLEYDMFEITKKGVQDAFTDGLASQGRTFGDLRMAAADDKLGLEK